MKQQLYSLGRIGFLLAIIVAVPQLHADEPKWEAAKIKNSPLSFGKLTDTGSITVEGKFTDAAATYNVLEEKDKFVKLSDGKQSGWVFKVSVNRTESVVSPPEPATKQSTDTPRDPLLGTEVFYKDSAIAKVGNEVVDKYKVLTWPATVEDVNGEWLWLRRAWVRRTDVMNLEQAFDYCIEEVRNNPKSARAWDGRARCWSERGELNNALRDYDEAIRLDPKVSVYFGGRANAKRDLKNFSGAILDYDEAIRLDRKCALSYNSRGWTRMQIHDDKQAIADFDQAMRLDSKGVYPINNKSFLLSSSSDETIRNPEQAMALAEQALAIDSKDAYAMNAKACAYAVAGDFEQAIVWEKKAMENADYIKDDGLDGGIHARDRIAKWEAKELWVIP